MLEHRIGNAILDHDFSVRFRSTHFRFRNRNVRKFLTRNLVTPILERAFGELHDVALVDERDAVALRRQGVKNRFADQPLRSEFRNRLDADGRVLANLRARTALHRVEKTNHALRAFGARRPLDPGIDVFGVLAKDHHVDFFRLTNRRGHALEVAHRPDAGVEVEHLTQRDVQRSDSAADRS